MSIRSGDALAARLAALVPDAGARATLTLHAAPGVGATSRRALRERHGDDAAVVEALPVDVRAAAVDGALAWCARAEAVGARVVARGGDRWPAAVDALDDVPELLWLRGREALCTLPAVAIVGTRRATPLALRTARAMAEAAARAGVCVVSGLALGVDAAAHEGALAADGATIAVLGTGVDVTYPRAHTALQRAVATRGLLLSEVPPGERGHGGTFPRRNRLIAALASHVVVVEAGEGSGALITAEYALTLGRELLVVPSRVDAPQGAGSNALLRGVARAVCSPAELLEELGVTAAPTAAAPALEGDAAACWDAIAAGLADPDAVARHARLDARRAGAALATLELHGLVTFDDGGGVRPLVTPAGR